MGAFEKILVVDGDAGARRSLTAALEAEGYNVAAVADGQAAIETVASAPPALAFLFDGLQTLRRIREIAPSLPVVVIATDPAAAAEVEKLGAQSLFTRPAAVEALVFAARRAIERSKLEAEVRQLRRLSTPAGELSRLLGAGAAMQKIVRQVEDVAPSPLTVVIVGEPGTGKELVARAIHRQSGQKGAFVRGDAKIETAGTIFVDDLAKLSDAAQVELNELIGNARRPRMIAATSEPLKERVGAGQFRQDLFYRLAEFVIRIPPLRDRPDDILPLATRFLEEAAVELRLPEPSLSEESQLLLRAHPWPRNVRELRTTVRQAMLLTKGSEIEGAVLRRLLQESEPAVPARGSLREIGTAAAAEAERAAIEMALRVAGGNKSEAARLLRTDFKTLHLKMKRFGIQRM